MDWYWWFLLWFVISVIIGNVMIQKYEQNGQGLPDRKLFKSFLWPLWFLRFVAVGSAKFVRWLSIMIYQSGSDIIHGR